MTQRQKAIGHSALPTPSNPALRIHFRHIPTDARVSFTGWVTNFQDQFNSSWKATPVYGRMDDLATFQRTGRKLAIAFDVLSADLEEARLNNHNLGMLAKFLYPVYEKAGRSSQNVLMAAPLLEMEWSSIIRDAGGQGGLVGYLQGFSYSPLVEEGFFTLDGGSSVLFKYYSVNLEYTVLHTHQTGWSREAAPSAEAGYSFGNALVERAFPHGGGRPGRTGTGTDSNPAQGPQDQGQGPTGDTAADANDNADGVMINDPVQPPGANADRAG